MPGADGLPDLGSGDHRGAAAGRRLIENEERGRLLGCPLFILVVAPAEHGKHLVEVVDQAQGAAIEGRLGILRGSVFGNWGVFHKITSKGISFMFILYQIFIKRSILPFL